MAQVQANLLHHEASFESKLRATGSVWHPEDVEQLMKDRYDAQRPGLLRRISPTHPYLLAMAVALAGAAPACASIAYIGTVKWAVFAGVWVGVWIFAYLVGSHAKNISDWRTNRLEHARMGYMRDFELHLLPPAIAARIEDIRQIEPRARFAVSFLGEDPVLWALFYLEEHAVAVWDENKDGSITIVPPPR